MSWFNCAQNLKILHHSLDCAYDSRVCAEANLEFSSLCQSTGSYEPLQNSNGYPFCVDKDGFATTDLGSIGESLNCKG